MVVWLASSAFSLETLAAVDPREVTVEEAMSAELLTVEGDARWPMWCAR
jgi:hypothetical protein